MTGYGRGAAKCSATGCEIIVELSSVNRKSLDLQLSAPREWSGVESVCMGWLKPHFSRGRVQVQIKVESTAEDVNGLCWNPAIIREHLGHLRAVSDAAGIPFAPDSNLILELARALRESAALPDWRELEDALEQAFTAALKDIAAMRQSEGTAIAADLSARIDELEALRATVAAAAKRAVPEHRDLLLDRLRQLELELDPDDERVLKELAFFADRCDVSEEQTRLASHFEQFKALIADPEPCGRKMDFLCQEILREFNTTASKATIIEITRAVIDAKNGIERIREQVQNVE